jgi:DNA-binding PadR family transcriptional regulator
MESYPSYYGKLCQRILEDEKYVSTLHYLTNKEEFQRVYGTKMKQRILSELSEFNTDKEIQTLQTLKPYLGTTMIFKLESILLDLNQSLMLHRAFGGGSAPLKMQVFIFADSSMISSKGKNISLPLSIRPSLEPFQKFYHSRFESRALSWDHWNSYVELESSFPCSGKKMYFSMSVMQFCILDCIVREGPQTIMDLVKKLEWDKSLILPLLHSLTRKDVPLLTKSGSGGSSRVSVHDVFDWNHVVEKILMDGIKHRFSLPLADTKTNVEPTGTPPKESQHRIRSQIMKILKKEQFSSASSLYQRLKRNGCEVSEKEMVDQLKYLEKQEYVERRNVKEREKEGDLYHYLP